MGGTGVTPDGEDEHSGMVADALAGEKPSKRKPAQPRTVGAAMSGMRFPVVEAGQAIGANWSIFTSSPAYDAVAKAMGLQESVGRLTSVAEQLAGQGMLSRGVLSGIESAAARGVGVAGILDAIGGADSSRSMLDQLGVSGALARASGVRSVIAWQDTVAVARYIGTGIQPAVGLMHGGLVDQLGEVAQHAQVLTSWAAHHGMGSVLLGGVAAEAVTDWRKLIFDLPAVPSRGDLWHGVTSGGTALGLTSTELLVTEEDLDVEAQEQAAEQVEREALHPWETGRLQVAGDLRTVIGRFDPTTPELLDGAWHDLHLQGPAAAVKAANCTLEVLDRVLRAAAPDDAVVAWHRAGNRPRTEWEDVDPAKGHPPHSLRIRYLMRDRTDLAGLAVAQLQAFLIMRSRARAKLQAIKHASRGDVATVRALTMTVEALLTGLLLEA